MFLQICIFCIIWFYSVFILQFDLFLNFLLFFFFFSPCSLMQLQTITTRSPWTLIVLTMIFQDNADPTIRNLGEFSPLDLAAQYGRLDVVKQLITTHPTLVNNLILNHSPLHLASRSGHRAIVQYLLDSGFSVNLKVWQCTWTTLLLVMIYDIDIYEC